MIADRRFTLDTNVLVYAVDRRAGAKHDQARALLPRAAASACILTVQALAEFFHATTRKRLLEPARASAFVFDWLEVFEVTAADRHALVDAMNGVREHRLSFWDAVLWATARQAGCVALLTEDQQHGRYLGGVQFIDPFRPSDSLEQLLDG